MKAAVLLITVTLFAFALGETLIYTATLQGNQVVQPVATTGEGSGEFEFDTDSLVLKYEIAFDFLGSAVGGAQIHGPGAVGTNAAVIHDLQVTAGGTAGEVKGEFTLTDAQAESLKSGLLYVDVHTEGNPGGELRGQILRDANQFKAKLEGSQQVPAVNSTKAKGSASITLNHETLQMEYSISHSVEGATAIHFHGPARAGTNAAPVITLEDISGDMDGSVVLTLEQAVFLRSELLYLNVHSEAHPDGEIRGQVLVDDGTSAGTVLLGLLGLIGILAVVAIVIALIVGAVIVGKKLIAKKKAANSSLDKPGISNEPLLNGY